VFNKSNLQSKTPSVVTHTRDNTKSDCSSCETFLKYLRVNSRFNDTDILRNNAIDDGDDDEER
jgi:hypothetical protein